MSIEITLTNEIQSTLIRLGGLITSDLTPASAPPLIFEGYLLSLVLQAADLENADIDYRDINNRRPTRFVFRASPGYIASTTRPYTYATIAFPGKPILEAHVGVRVVGTTGVLHQCDIAVIKQEEADRCRRESRPAQPGQSAYWVSPKQSELILAVEAKFYDEADLDLDLARSFIGLVSDISRPSYHFVASTSSNSVERLLTKKKKNWEHNIVPASTIEVTRLINAFQTTFRNFKTTY
ncbi:MAG TPA: hypothetical protein VFV38_02085 [Ktedonobacteraceae bacterium]|nr:hypothetical protein [Ktedonobacteraceae bacterium]